VPFGEFIPTGFRWFTEMMNIPLGDFSARRHAPAVVRAALGQRVRAQHLLRRPVRRGTGAPLHRSATAPTLMVNLSNIGWFGDTIAVPQHLNISRCAASSSSGR
jgi:apolipoprotein N-acyltransferase